ncbi:MAG: HD-GYP domain-containing protein [Caldiserica bacterium]|jgi:HD-GYP domain-containing protein (c-di-GMP phosphodiesterase class II)|nr:HD-GYP domain-containing protein [Caldisericota bacterium]MDH7561816.1 HD-GYP domain-containing protein [Caldisericota bacterium]
MGSFKAKEKGYSTGGKSLGSPISSLNNSLAGFCASNPKFHTDNLGDWLAKNGHNFKKERDLLEFALEYGKDLLRADKGTIFYPGGKRGIEIPKDPPFSSLAGESWPNSEIGSLKEPRIITANSETILVPVLFHKNKHAVFAFSSRAPGWAKENFFSAINFSNSVSWALKNWRLEWEKEKTLYEAVRTLWQTVYAKDPNSAKHLALSRRIGEALGNKLEITPPEKNLLQYSLMLHDIGKIGVPGSILNKPGPLSEEEWKIVRLHPQIGAKILKPFTSLKKIVPAVLHHHERWDGLGYPDGLKKTEIPFLARIVSLVDAIQAMRSDRPYRKTLSLNETLKEVEKGAGSQFDPEIAGVFLKMATSGALRGI